MATKLRLQRHGKKGKPFYHLVAADERAKRDGKFIEKLGTYNPNTNPATIDINFESTLNWMMKGAQPTDTVRAILSYKGVLYKKHLLGGVAKGALTEEQAEKKFQAWLDDKNNRIKGKSESLTASEKDAALKKLALEKEASEKRAAEIAAKSTPPAEEETVTAEATEETPVAEVTEEAPAAEATEEKEEEKGE